MADQKRDYYEVLGLNKDASESDIKKSFRKLAKEHHPDLNPGDKAAEARFKEINEAYEVLSDQDKKARYDQFGHAGVDPNFGAGGGGGGGGAYSGGFGDFDFDLGDIFNSFFGGGGGGGFSGSTRNQNAPRKGENIHTNISIKFEEAAFGCEKEVSVSAIVDCEVCEGTGASPGTTAEVCSACNGTGTVKVQQRTAFGVMSSSTSCNKCGGTGKIIHQPCTKCRGKGKVRKQQKVTIKIPAGIDDGQTVSLRGRGHVGLNGGPKGDLLVTVSVTPHKIFERDGYSILSKVPVSITQAALGAEVMVPTLDGKVKYSIPEGTQSGTVFRLKGKGVPYLNSNGRGDHYITAVVNIPTSLNNEQKELLRKFAEIMGEDDTEPKGAGIFNKKKKK